jgi:hypothetical protein
VTGPRDRLLSGFCVTLSTSGLLPWAQVGRADRLGREMHAPLARILGRVLSSVAEDIPRLLWLEAQVFDEDPERLELFSNSITAAGAQRRARNRSYSTTLLLPVGKDPAEFMGGITSRARRKVRGFDRRPGAIIRPVDGAHYLERMRSLYRESFMRTGAVPPPFPVEAMLEDASGGKTSALLGAFLADRQPPDDLVGFVWSRFHGDYISYDVAASDRGGDLGSLAPGYALIRDLADWGRRLGARWVDLGGISEARAQANPRLRGIHEFKEAFWSEEANIAAEFEVRPESLPASIGRTLLRVTRGS